MKEGIEQQVWGPESPGDRKPNNYFFPLGVFFGRLTELLWSPTERSKLENSPSVAVSCGPNCSRFQECAKTLSHSFIISSILFSKAFRELSLTKSLLRQILDTGEDFKREVWKFLLLLFIFVGGDRAMCKSSSQKLCFHPL